MHMTRTKMKKECIMATSEADTADTIFLSDSKRPKSRITRQARISRTSQAGMPVSATSAKESSTTATSSLR